MEHKVGPKGQVVIAKEIRERLRIQSGWLALQRLVDDHVEIHFLPPEHSRSLAGSLAQFTAVRIPGDEELERAIDRAWDETIAEDPEWGEDGR